MPNIRVNDIEMYYEVYGSGAPLVFIGGSGGGGLRQSMVDKTPLVDRFRVLSFDQRGQGQTDKPDILYTIAMFADDAAGLMDATGFGRAMVMGASFGGMVAQELTLRHPEKVLFLVLCCTCSGGAGGSAADYRAALQDASKTTDEDIKADLSLVDTRRTAEYLASHPEETELLVQQLRSAGQQYPMHSTGAPRLFAARSAHDAYDRLGQIRVPTLVMGGKYDGVTPPEYQKRMAAAIPGAELHMFEGGHQFLSQDREAAYSIIVNRLTGYLSQPMFGSGVAGL